MARTRTIGCIRYRPLETKDIPQHVRMIAERPDLSRQYGAAFRYLAPALRRVVGHPSVHAVVIEELHRTKPKQLGLCIGAFVNDEFFREIKTVRGFWGAPEIARRIVQGHSPLLSEGEVAEANTRGGLNVLTWHNTIHPDELRRQEVAAPCMAAFEEGYRGFLLKEVIGQATNLALWEAMKACSGQYFDAAKQEWGDFPERAPENPAKEPHIVGACREKALTSGLFWLCSFFVHQRPKFCFRRSEQRLLAAALEGAIDSELSKTLKISVSAIKKTWRAIYERVEQCQPGLVEDESEGEETAAERGKQKRQRLLGYLREHPEELRPISRKLWVARAAI